ncbi:hypothetical protein ScPMuIL_007727 [Solemya velum]
MITGVVLLLFYVASAEALGCQSNRDCGTGACCNSMPSPNLLGRSVRQGTCQPLSEQGDRCPLVGSILSVTSCGCSSGFVCYHPPSGIQPIYGTCVTQAFYDSEQQRIRENPNLLMIPAAHPAGK